MLQRPPQLQERISSNPLPDELSLYPGSLARVLRSDRNPLNTGRTCNLCRAGRTRTTDHRLKRTHNSTLRPATRLFELIETVVSQSPRVGASLGHNNADPLAEHMLEATLPRDAHQPRALAMKTAARRQARRREDCQS